jgi:hypothetical protein
LPKVFCFIHTTIITILVVIYIFLPFKFPFPDNEYRVLTPKEAIGEYQQIADKLVQAYSATTRRNDSSEMANATLLQKYSKITGTVTFFIPLIIIGISWFIVNTIYRRGTTGNYVYTTIYIALLTFNSIIIGLLSASIFFMDITIKIFNEIRRRILSRNTS